MHTYVSDNQNTLTCGLDPPIGRMVPQSGEKDYIADITWVKWCTINSAFFKGIHITHSRRMIARAVRVGGWLNYDTVQDLALSRHA